MHTTKPSQQEHLTPVTCMRYRLRTLLILMLVVALVAAFIRSGLEAYRATLQITERAMAEEKEAREARLAEIELPGGGLTTISSSGP